MSKATHDGTCQVCGRQQALPRGKMAKHGYDVQFRFFNGICPGADHLPLEQDRAFADEVAAGLLVTSRSKAADALAVSRGELLPMRAKSGRTVMANGRNTWERVPFADAPEQYRQEAVRQLQHQLYGESADCIRTSEGITARADAITGKRELQARTPVARKAIVAGTHFKLGGVEYVALRVESRQAYGCGPFLNGRVMPHVMYTSASGNLRAYPVRLIRQAAIL